MAITNLVGILASFVSPRIYDAQRPTTQLTTTITTSGNDITTESIPEALQTGTNITTALELISSLKLSNQFIFTTQR